MCDAAEYVVPCEWTLARIVQDAIVRGLLPERFIAHGNITIGGEIISREYWPAVRARNGAPIHMWIPPMDPLSIGSAIGSLLFSAGASVGLVNAAIAATTFLAPAVIGIAGQLAVNALFRPPQSALNDSRDSVANANRAAISQNIPQKGQSYPFCFGTARVAPQPICYARTYLSGDNVYAEAVLALAGPHSMSDIRVGGVPIVDDDAIETWVDDGTASSRTNQFSEYAYTAQISAELAAQDIRVGENTFTDQELRDQATPANSLPPWVRCASRRNADRLELRLLIRNPFDAGAGLANQIIWFRLRARQIGTSTWKNIGTLPYRANGQGDFRRQIAFHFARYPGGVSDVKKEPNGFIIPSTQPAVTVDHAVIKIADGERFPAAYAFTYKRDAEGIDIWPNDDAGEAYFTTGDEFEFELQRSEMVEQSELGVGDTEIAKMETSGGSVFDYFDARLSGGKWLANENTDDQGDQLYLESAVSVFEQPPVPEGANMATLSIRSKNKELNEITVLGSALIPAWNGTIFTGQTATSNPADHYRNINCGSMTVSPLADIYSDDEALGDWADECIANSYEINLAYYGKFGEARDIVASAGYARPLEGLKQSITWYRDTSAELPVQAFTPRNTRNYSWSLAFTRRPGAILAKFLNSAKDFSDDEIVIEDPYDVPGASADIEEVDFPGLTTEAQVTARALFDFQQAHNAVRHRVEVGFEYLTDETRPGKVAILSNDALHSQAAWARVASVVDGTSFTIDADLEYTAPVSFFDLADVFSTENIFGSEEWGVFVRSATSEQVIAKGFSGYDSGTRTVTASDTTDMAEGDLCVFGPMRLTTRRVLITEVNPLGDGTAEIVCMDEIGGVLRFTVTLEPGSFALTGQDVSISGGAMMLTLDAGTFALAGQDIALLRSLSVAADYGAFTLTGQDVALSHGRTMAADFGSFALAGQDISFLNDRVMTADYGAFALTGQDIAAKRALIMPAEYGSFSLSGQDIGLIFGHSMVADYATFALAGQDLALLRALKMTADHGSFALSGQAVNLTRNLSMAMGTGSFALAGQDATLTFVPGSVSSITFHASATADATTITIPATVQDGDFAVLFDFAGGSSAPSDVTPSGWTSNANLAGLISGGFSFRSRISYRILTAALAGTSVTGMVSGGATAAKVMLVFRPNVAASTLTLGDPATGATSGNPASQTLTSGSGAAPLVALGFAASYNNSPTFSTASPAFGGEVASGTVTRAGYKIYNSSPSNHTVDMNDLGTNNVLSTLYLEVA